MRVLWLADVLRAAGLTVVEHAGWKTRGWEPWDPQCGIVHATAAPATQPDSTQVAIVRDGREDLQGPIAVACVDRAGRWHVLASGRCNTTLTGTAGPFEGYGNQRCLGVEACNDNRTEPWPAVQYAAYYRGWAAICRRLGWGAARLVGHKEHTPGRKTDPTFDMNRFRADVARVLAGEDNEMELTDRVPSASTPDQPNRTVDMVLGDLWRGVHLRLTAWMAAVEQRLAAAEAREIARDVGQTALIERLGTLAGVPLTDAQLQDLHETLQDATAVVGERVLAELRRQEAEREAGLAAQLAAQTTESGAA